MCVCQLILCFLGLLAWLLTSHLFPYNPDSICLCLLAVHLTTSTVPSSDLSSKKDIRLLSFVVWCLSGLIEVGRDNSLSCIVELATILSPEELFYVLSIKLFSHTRTVYSFTSLISLPSFIVDFFYLVFYWCFISSSLVSFHICFIFWFKPLFLYLFLAVFGLTPSLFSHSFYFFLFMYIPPELDTGNFPVSWSIARLAGMIDQRSSWIPQSVNY